MTSEISRRDFLKSLGITAGMIALGSFIPSVLAAEASDSTHSVQGGPEHPGNCISGESDETKLSREWYIVYLNSEKTFELRYGGKGTEKAPGSFLEILDQGIIPGTNTPFYVTEYQNRSGNNVIHYCSVTNRDKPVPEAWWKEEAGIGETGKSIENKGPIFDLPDSKQSRR